MLMESGWGFSGLPSWGLSSDGAPCRPPVSTTDQPPPTPCRAEDPRERQCVLRHELNCQLRLRPEETALHEGGKGQARSQLDAAPHEAERTQDRQGHLLTTGPSCWPAAGPAFPGSGWPGGHALADRLQWPGPGGHLLPNLYAQATPGPHAVPPWTSPAAGTDACQPQADPAPRGPPTALGAFRSLDPEDPLTCQGALPVGTEPRTPPGIGLCARPSPSRVRVTATCARGSDHCGPLLVPMGTGRALQGGPGPPPTTLAFLRLHQRFHHHGQPRARVSQPPHPHPRPSLGRGERGPLRGPHSSPGGRGRSQPSPTAVKSHATASAARHCTPGVRRPHGREVSGRGGVGGGGVNICIKGKKKKKNVYQLGRGNIYLL